MTIPIAHAFMADTWGTCIVAIAGVVVLVEFISVSQKTELNMSEYRPDYLLLVRHWHCGPGDSRSWESPEKADNIWRLFIQILLR